MCISNFGESQLLYLHQLLVAYDNMTRFEIDLVLHTTTELNLRRYRFRARQILCEPALGRDLALQHRQVMIQSQDDYDLFVYCENDVLLDESHLLAFCEASKELPHPYVAGFIRYECNRKNLHDPEQYLPDAHPQWPVIEKTMTIESKPYVQLANRHQGCFVLKREQLKHAIRSPHFKFFIPADPLNCEVGATFVYIGCGLCRVIPLQRIDSLLVHHLSDKYVNSDQPPWNVQPPHTLRTLKALINGGTDAGNA